MCVGAFSLSRADEEKLSELRQCVVKDSKRNFNLERDLMEIDEKIKLLVKNRITVQEVTLRTFEPCRR